MSAFEQIFHEAERATMSFLTTEHAFEKTEDMVDEREGTQYVLGAVTYREKLPWHALNRNSRFITLSVAPLRLEVDLDIGVGDEKLNRYTIYELHQLECGGDFPSLKHGLYDAMNDADKLREVFEVLTGVLKRCGSRFFNADSSLWKDLKNQRTKEAQERADSYISKDAEKAFKEKNWLEVVNLLERMEDRLNKVEIARLNYARKQCRNVT